MTMTPQDHHIHHGRNIKRFREMMQLKQEDLADKLGEDWSQKKISQLESKVEIDDAILEQVARTLNVSTDALKNYSDEAAINYFNTFNDYSVSHVIGNYGEVNINPVEEWLKALDENKQLYERLLKSEQEKVALLEKLLQERK